MMDPLSTLVLAPLAKKVTGQVLDAAGRRVAAVFDLPARRVALERCVEAGILAVGHSAFNWWLEGAPEKTPS